MVADSHEALCSAYDLAMLDLDGVVYVGADAVPGAPQHLHEVAATGMRTAFITNNASRSPQEVADHLSRLGVQALRDDVVTSAQAAARLLVERLGTGARVALLGGAGLREALDEVGLRVVDVGERSARAIVTGYGPEVRWREVMRAAVVIREGLWWVASNRDLTIPTPYGTAPGHGLLVETLERFSGVEPVVAGKPARPLLDETVRRVGGRRPLMVGDRLDTDIAGAHHAGMDSLLVLTGVTGLTELVAAKVGERPTYISTDLGGLLVAHERPTRDGGAWVGSGWRVRVERGGLSVSGSGPRDVWWQVVACAAWAWRDDTGEVVGVDGVACPA